MTDKFLEGSKDSRRRYFEENAELMNRLVDQDQSPVALLITCSDARIMPERLLEAKPGQFFVFRNIANLVPPYWQTELAVSAVLEFAVKRLAVADIIICGHTYCGGINSLVKGTDLSTEPGLSRWIEIARPAMHTRSGRTSDEGSASRLQAIAERNVLNQIENLKSYPFVRSRQNSGDITLHGWIYCLQAQQIRYYDSSTASFVST